jgi:hypothetical protein
MPEKTNDKTIFAAGVTNIKKRWNNGILVLLD